MHTRAMSRSNDAWELCIQRTSNDSALLDVLVRGARRRCGSAATGGSGDRPSKNWSEAVREVVTAAFNDDRVALLLREKMRSCSYGSHGRTGGAQQMPSTTVGLVGEEKTRTVAESPHEDAPSVHKVIFASKGKSDQERPLWALGPEKRSTECDNTPGHARESRGSERTPTGGAIPLFPTDSVAQLTHCRCQKRPGERGAGYGDVADDLALAAVKLSPGLVGGGVGVDGVGGVGVGVGGGGGSGGGGGGDGGGGGGGEGGGRGGGERGGRGRGGAGGAALSVSGVHAPFAVNSDIELGKNQDHEAPPQVKQHPRVSVDSQLDMCGLGGEADGLPQTRPTGTSETGEGAARGSAEGCCPPPALPPVRLSPSLCDPTAATAAAVHLADIAEDTEDSTLLLGVSALHLSPTLSTEETLVEGAAVSEATDSVVPPLVTSERQNNERDMPDGVNEVSNTPHAAVGTFVLVGDGGTGGAQAVTGVADSAHVQFGTSSERSGAGVAAVLPAEESSQTGGGAAVGVDGVRDSTIPHNSAAPLKVVEEEVAVEIAATAAVAVGLDVADTAVVVGRSAGRGVTVEREPLPDPTEEEDYAYDFESPKCVRFSSESLWSVHEVRASFERHELADLFYTVDELDRMSEEAEREEREEQSEANLLQEGGVEADGSWVYLGGDTPAAAGVDVSDSIADISIESHSLDEEDSDDRF